MPELPDVELIRGRLDRRLRGGTITSARSADRYVLRPASPAAFGRALTGRTVDEVDRRGKWLRVRLDDGTRLFSHLGLTGWWVERGPDDPAERFERARVDVERPRGRRASFRYVDSRRFGRLRVSKDDIPEWTELGPDPLHDRVDVQALATTLAKSRRAIKDALMDQSVLAGVGNILATEALWRARIDPRSRSDALSRADVSAVVRALRDEIRRELRVRERAKGDEWHDVFDVYGRVGEPCRRCGATIVKAVIGGRTSAFCERCQIRRGS